MRPLTPPQARYLEMYADGKYHYAPPHQPRVLFERGLVARLGTSIETSRPLERITLSGRAALAEYEQAQGVRV